MPSLFSKLQDPDNVGSSEYRAIYDCIGDAQSTDEDRDVMIVVMLHEFLGHSLSMLKAIGHTVQIEVTSTDGNAILKSESIEAGMVNVIQIDSEAEAQHVLTYKDVSIYQAVKDFREEQLSDCWMSTMSNTDWESDDAFDVRDLPEPPGDFKPEGVDHDNSEHMALAYAIELGHMHDDGYKPKQ